MDKIIKPQNDRVLIKPFKTGEEMYGNIVIPDMGKEKPEMGEVIAVGPGRTTEFGTKMYVQAKVGSTVLVSKLTTLKIKFENQDYYIVQDREILATIEETQEPNE